MATKLKEVGTDIVAVVEASPVIVLTDEAKFNQFYEAIREECEQHEPDLSTDKGRKAIASLAYKVARTKTAIDDAGKKLNEEARARINAVDEARRKIRQQLDDLRDEVRRPLTEWEEAEEARAEAAAEQLAAIQGMQRVDIADTAEAVQQRIDALEAMVLDPDVHQAGIGIAEAAKATTLQMLRDAHARLVREEEERAELARLREAEAERQRQEQERLAAEEAEKAERERLAQIEREAEDRARREAEEAAKREADERERRHQEELAAERRRAEEAERAAQAERDRAIAEEAVRKANAEREAEENRRRAADREHRSRVMTEAKQAIMACGAEDGIAREIVLAIVGKSIPHVSIQF